MGLLSDEAGADAYYGLPAGTLEALGASESSQGTNLGSIGNIFQVLPSTAAQPGYGLSSVNGNDPYSVGAYLSALINGPGQGSVAAGLSLYQGNGNNPSYTGTNAPMSQFLASLAGNPSGPAATATGTPSGGQGASTGTTSTGSSISPSSWISSIEGALGQYASRGALILLAIVLLLGAVFLYVFRTERVDIANA